jgi:EpsI family protein
MLALGTAFTMGAGAQRTLPLRRPLAEALPATFEDLSSVDLELTPGEARTTGVTAYLLRSYVRRAGPGPNEEAFSLYVGYYDRQTQGRTIHSPKNCLPGAGWEPVASGRETIEVAGKPTVVNRYLLQFRQRQALVFYWYQGRGRVEADEYAVKWHLLRDASLRRRSEEALVRIIVPVRTTVAEAAALARRAAASVVPAVYEALPT